MLFMATMAIEELRGKTQEELRRMVEEVKRKASKAKAKQENQPKINTKIRHNHPELVPKSVPPMTVLEVPKEDHYEDDEKPSEF